MPCCPLTEAIEGLAGDQQILEQDEQGRCWGHPAAAVLMGKMIAEKLAKAKPLEEGL
jgi:hypothetical protein